MSEDYRRARKRGLKQLHADEQAGAFPHPPALDDLLAGQPRHATARVGTVELDLSLIAGTKQAGRQNVFASDFMPLARETSEFAMKWASLCRSAVAEGIREPVEVFEYLQHFYVQEGNKRVSVARYLGSPTIEARVTRVLPHVTEDDDRAAYREFLRFYAVAPIYGIALSEAGDYVRLADLLGQDLEHRWPEELVRRLRSLSMRFARAYEGLAEETQVTSSDALLVAIEVCGFEGLYNARGEELASIVERLRGEFAAVAGKLDVAYIEDPEDLPRETGVVDRLMCSLRSFYSTYQAAVEGPTVVAFVYDDSPVVSRWVAAHERGREELEKRLGDTVETIAYHSCAEDDDFDAVVADAVERGADLVVTVSPTQIDQALRAAVRYPEVEFINCSVSLSHEPVRVFSGRLYEAKFLLGALAAALSRDHRIGYVAESPVFNSVAEVNAFARGAETVDAHAQVHLLWQEAKGEDPRTVLAAEGISVIFSHDFEDPRDPTAPWGLWQDEGDGLWTQLAAPVWDWGLYYERLVRSLRNDTWRIEGERMPRRALNYWWGMSSGVVDVRLGETVPEAQARLVDLLRQGVVEGTTEPFSGELTSQDGPVQPSGSPRLPSDAIARMDWLAHNVVGRLPRRDELTEGGLSVVRVSGLPALEEERLSEAGAAAADKGAGASDADKGSAADAADKDSGADVADKGAR